MTTPPLPASPCLRVRLNYGHDSGLKAGSRFYLSYSGSAPTGGNCITLASDISTSWGAHLQDAMNPDWFLQEIDVLDIASDSGASGQWSGVLTGGRSGTPLPAQVAMNVEYGIARRYRGGKPRMYVPPSITGDLATDTTWNGSWANTVAAAVGSMMGDIAALDVGSLGTLAHVNLSYYKSFTNVSNTSGRMRAAPKYRDVALVDPVESYISKTELGSQRRRRVSTTP